MPKHRKNFAAKTFHLPENSDTHQANRGRPHGRHPNLLQGSMLKQRQDGPRVVAGKMLLVCLIKKGYLFLTKIGTGVHLMLIHKRATCYYFLLQNLPASLRKTKRQEAMRLAGKVNCNRGGGWLSCCSSQDRLRLIVRSYKCCKDIAWLVSFFPEVFFSRKQT